MGKWRLWTQTLCAIILTGGFGAYGRQGNGFRRECERTEKALRVVKFPSAMREEMVMKLVRAMLGWLFMEPAACH
jgi:hypothetical protein